MLQKVVLQGMVFFTGLMTGVILECWVFHPFRGTMTISEVRGNGPSQSSSVLLQSSNAKRSGPAIHVDEPVYRFGVAEVSAKIQYSFLIKNVGTQPLDIIEIESGCGCTTTKMDERKIAPGHFATLHGVLSLNDRLGSHESAITIRSNDPHHGKLKLSLVGNVVSAVTVTPASVDFGRLSADGSASPACIKVEFAERLPIKVLTVSSTNPAISIDYEEVVPLKSYNATISLLPNTPAGAFHGWVRLMTDHPDRYREIAVPVKAYVGPGGPILVEDQLDFRGHSMDGEIVDFKNVRGKVSIVAFWSSTCRYCKKELPELIDLYKQHNPEGLAIVGVNCDQSAQAATAAIKNLHIEWPNITAQIDSNNSSHKSLMDRFDIRAIPMFYVVGPDGRVKWSGSRVAALKIRVEKMLQPENATPKS